MQRTITMLIADDSPSHASRSCADAARSHRNCRCVSPATDNGRECLTLLNGANIDLAFIDVHMPELSGTEAFWSARKQGIKTFVTLMSTPPAAEAVDMAIKLRAYEFLFKPFTVSDAVGIIKTYARISSPTKILIVDNSSAVRQIVQKIVHGSVFNCEITEAGDGDTALAPVPDHGIRRRVPRSQHAGHGRTFDHEAASAHPIVAEDRDDVGGAQPQPRSIRRIDAGACAFLQKPFHSEDVDRVLHAAFGLRSPNLKLKAASRISTSPSKAAPSAWRTKSAAMSSNICGRKSRLICATPSCTAASACDIAPARVAPAAEETALLQLRPQHLLAA